jgi:uncharacterized protein
MEELLDDGADVNAPAGFESHQTQPPLTLAAGNGDSEAVRLLLRRGADVNVRGNNNLTPLIAAVWGGHTDVVRVLIAGGADVNADSSFGDALSIAKDKNYVELIDILNNAAAKGTGDPAQSTRRR